MHCKHCGAMIEENQKICPECGANLMEEPEETAAVQAAEDDMTTEMESAAEVVTEGAKAAVKGPMGKKQAMGLLALILALAVIVGAAALLFMNRDKTPYTGPMESDQYIVATCNGKQLTNQMFMFYYWGQFYQLYSQYGNTLSYMGLDMKKPFEDQKFDETRTWADFFTDYALMQWTRDVAISEAVAKEGYTLSEAQKGQLQAMLDNLETDATKAGYANGEEYLKHAFDLSVDVESYNAYTTTSYINSSYLSSKYKEFQEEGKVNPGNHKDVYYIDIRHVLIKFADSTEGAKTAAKKEAEALYEAFKQNPTMDAFAAMAKEHSDDNANGTGGSAANGGLIEKVYPGQMVENFDKWCFAADRKAGDHGLVETEYGWHLMYFDGFNEQIFMTAAQSYAEEKYGAWEEDLFKQFALTDFRDKITFRHAK